MSTSSDVQRMMYAVAARFHFPENEMWNMTERRLQFWYHGHALLCEEEEKILGGK